ncbi:MAG: hypothetical protein KTR25_00080 [Myxococcales bacterium]|nr:hypothetical protein [Myxococcales bacterium]
MDVISHFLQLPDTGFGVFGLDADGRLLPQASESSKQLLREPLTTGEIWPLPDCIDPVAGGIIAVDDKWVELRPLNGPANIRLWSTKDITALVETDKDLQTTRWLLKLAPQRHQALTFVERELSQLAHLHEAPPKTLLARIARIEAQATCYQMTALIEACQLAVSPEGILQHGSKLRQALEDILLINLQFSEEDHRTQINSEATVDIDVIQKTFQLMCKRLARPAKLVVGGKPEHGHAPLAPAIIPLLENALIHGFGSLHGQKTPTVWLYFIVHDDHWAVSIKDNGSGLAVSQLQQRTLDSGKLSVDQLKRLKPHEHLALVFIAASSPAGSGFLHQLRSGLTPLGGNIELRTEPGLSTTVILRLPR